MKTKMINTVKRKTKIFATFLLTIFSLSATATCVLEYTCGGTTCFAEFTGVCDDWEFNPDIYVDCFNLTGMANSNGANLDDIAVKQYFCDNLGDVHLVYDQLGQLHLYINGVHDRILISIADKQNLRCEGDGVVTWSFEDDCDLESFNFYCSKANDLVMNLSMKKESSSNSVDNVQSQFSIINHESTVEIRPNGAILNMVSIYSLSGKLVVQYNNVSSLKSIQLTQGAYIIEVLEGQEKITKKIIIR